MNNDSLGDRMKDFEGRYADRLMPLLPAVARLDGNNFHNFTKGLKRPFDQRLSDLMIATTRFLAELSNATIAYTQSDEISLIWNSDVLDSQIYFDGKVNKINSILAAKASVFFNKLIPQYLPEKAEISAAFDCRTFNLPTKAEAGRYLLWRELDATRNSIQMAGQSQFSHSELQGINCNEIQEMLFQQRNINWNEYPDFFKRGTYIQRQSVTRPFTAEEIEALPEKHNARKNPNLVLERSQFSTIKMPRLAGVQNREAVIFNGEKPEVWQGSEVNA